jgi:hypothetical protein
MVKERENREDRFAPKRVLLNWRELMEAIVLMNEEELHAALKYEVAHERRKDFIERLHSKFSRFRRERELKEYMGE